LLPLRHLDINRVVRYKRYVQSLDSILLQSEPIALEANKSVFSDAGNLARITRFVRTGRFPWEVGTNG